MAEAIKQAPQTPTMGYVNDASVSNHNSWAESPQASKQEPQIQIQNSTTHQYAPIHNEKDEINRSSWTETPEPKKDLSNVRVEEGVEDDDGIDWKPGFSNQFPWIGFAGLLTIIFATAMAVAILAVSNEKRVKDWPFQSFPIQPNVLLNIANQVQNLGLITLIGQGLAIAWWRKVLQGSSLNTLHRNHAYSYSFYSILTSGKHFNIIALAALMTKFAVIDSTLFQKATKTVITQQRQYANSSVTGWVQTEWKPFSGGVPSDEGTIKTVDAAWASVIEAYNGKIANSKMHDMLEGNASFFNCPYRQECSGAIKGLGFGFNCTTSTEDIDYGLQRSSQQGGVSSSYPLWDISFNSSWASPEKPYASVKLDMLYVDSHAGNATGSCPGVRTKRTCEIRPALVEYPVIVMTPSQEELKGKNIVTHIKFFDDSKFWPISTSLDNINQIDGVKFVDHVNMYEQFGNTSTVGAITYVLNNLYSSSANLTYDNDWNVLVRGSQAQTTFYADNDNEDFSRCWYDIDKPGKDDPAIELLRKVNTLSFVTALYLNGAPTIDVSKRKAAGLPSQTVLTSVTGIVEEYTTDFKYVAGALVATLVTVLCVLPVYWGFWQVGRKVTLGPLEIAHAFNAPIIAPEQTKKHHGDFEEVLHEVGKRRVQYGQLRNEPQGNMGIAEPQNVVRPDARDRFAQSSFRRKVGIGAVLGGAMGAAVGASKT